MQLGMIARSREHGSRDSRQGQSRLPIMKRTFAFFAAATMTLALSGCSDAKTYDIGPIFPLTADKCAKYHGDEKGQGITASCMVTKAECDSAVADWNRAMQEGSVNDAMKFTCN